MHYSTEKRLLDSQKLFLVVLMLLLAPGLVFGQGIVTGSISGTALDPQGAVLVGANVRATQVETNRMFTTVSSKAGVIQLPSLPAGTYTVVVEAKGFSSFKAEGVVVEVGKDTGLGPITLKLGGTAETVTVEGTAPLVESTTDQLSQTFDNKEVANIPLGNTYDSFVLFTPGVASSGSGGFENNNGAELSINGQRSRSNNYQLDGEANNDTVIGGPSFFFGNQDAIAELQVVTNFDAEYGRNMGGVVNYVTKGGTNAFHGTGYEFWQGDTFDSFQNQEKNPILGFCPPGVSPSTGCTQPVIPQYVQNQWGGTIGGPIKRDKIWFFGSTNWQHNRSSGVPLSTSPDLTPDATGIKQLQTAFPNNPAVTAFSEFGPATVNVGRPVFSSIQNVLVSNQGDAVTCTTAGVNGCVPIEMGTLSNFVTQPYNDREATGRVDFQLTNKDRFFTRYLYQFSETFNEDFFGPGAGAAGQIVNVPGKTQQIGLDLTHTFNPSFLNQVRFGYSRSVIAFDGGAFGNCLLTDAGVCPPSIGFTGTDAANALETVPLGQSFLFPQGRIINDYQVQDNASMVHGHHVMKWGGEYSKLRSPSYGLFPQNGDFEYTDYSNFLANTPVDDTTTVAYGQSVLRFKENDVGLYYQDDWRLRDNLTVNLGLRWDWYQQAANLLHNESVAQQTGPAPLWSTSLPLSLTTVPNLPNNYHNFGPVLGFAWTPHILPSLFGENKTVIRGGFRIAYDFIFYNLATNVEGSAPFTNLATIPNAAGTGAAGLPNVTPIDGASVTSALFPLAPKENPGNAGETKFGNNLRNPYSQQWNLGIERQITGKMAAEARYVGNHTVANFQEVNGNPAIGYLVANGFGNVIPAGLTPCANQTAPGWAGGVAPANNPNAPLIGVYANCNFSKVVQYTNTGYSIYDGLQTQFRLQNYHGFTGEMSYTWSHTIDNASEAFSANSGLGTIFDLAQSPFDISRAERANSSYSFPNLFNVLWVYDLPFRKGQSGFLGHLMGGWQINGTYRYSSGQPWTVLQSAGQGLCDPTNFTGTSPYDACRPFLGNTSAPFNQVGLYCNASECANPAGGFYPAGTFVSLNNGLTPSTPSQARFIINNLAADQVFGTPFSPLGRNTERGQPISTVNMGVFKNVKITERLTMQLQAEAFNLFNHMWLGIPNVNANAAATSSDGVTVFGSRAFNSDGGDTFAGNNITDGIQQRRLQLGAKIIF
jgi:outer membrane receptor protein involved in Fe transport